MSNVETGTLIPYLTEMFRYQAWMAMGKVTNPMSGKIERDLNVARQMIDLLAELETRTEGNRSGDETKMLQGVLTELRLNYMEESKKPDPEPESNQESNPDPEPDPEPEKETGEPSGTDAPSDDTVEMASSSEDAKETE